MTTYIARFGGLVLALLAIVVGVLIGRVIEAIAVAIVLWAAWGYVVRLTGAKSRRITPRRRRSVMRG
jgi:hypothetical protein